MLQTDSLHRRLDAPNLRVEMTKADLMRRQKWNDGHKLTSGELQARYAYLKSVVAMEIRDREAHGDRVTSLEQAIFGWIENIDI